NAQLEMGGVSFIDLPPIHTSAAVTPDGDIAVTYKGNPFKSPSTGPVQITWGGMSGNLSLNHTPESLRGAMTSTPFSIESPEFTISVQSIKVNLDLKEGPSQLMVGRQNVSFGAIESTGKKGEFSLKGLRLSNKINAAEDTINYAVKQQIKEVRVNGVTYGPGALELSLRRLDAATLAEMKGLASSMRKGAGGGGQEGAPGGQEIMRLVAQLAKKSPTFEINRLNFTTGEGKLDGSLKLLLDGSKGDPAQNPAQLLSFLEVDAELTIAAPLLRKIMLAKAKRDIVEQRLRKLVSDGFFVREEGAYRIVLAFREGSLSVNGKKRDELLPALMMQAATLGKGGVRGTRPQSTVVVTPPASDPKKIQEDIRILADTTREWPERSNAASRLGWSKDRRAVKPLADALNDSEWAVRQRAALALGEIGDASSVKPLIAAMEGDESVFVRKSAAESLGKIGDRRAVGALRRALNDDEVLTTIVNDETREVRAVAVAAKEALAKISGSAGSVRGGATIGGGALSPQHGVRVYVPRDMIELPPGGDRVEGYIAVLESEKRQWIERNEAVRRLGNLKDGRAVDPLINALKNDPEPFVRREAALALGRIGDERAGEALKRVPLEESDEWVVMYALEALKMIEAPDEALSDRWAVNLASYFIDVEATLAAEKLRGAGYNAYVTEADIRGKRYYRLRVGFYPSEEKAGRAAAELARTFKMSEAWVVKPARSEVESHLR
ncbi:MAG: DUF945 family protein, partial [Thermodesulfobacteriota bacterium]